VTVYSEALQRALRENVDVRNGTAISAKIKGQIYDSESVLSSCAANTRQRNVCIPNIPLTFLDWTQVGLNPSVGSDFRSFDLRSRFKITLGDL